jgi:hypothetical protein
MNNSNESIKTESLTLSRILSSMKAGQLWMIVVIFAGIISGSFGLGYKLRSSVAESEIARIKTELTALQTSVKQFRGLQTKEIFLALYLRYLLAKEAQDRSASVENERAKEAAASNLKSYIQKLLERGEEAKDEIDLRGLFLGKSGGSEATVKFGYDGSVWPVPREFGFEALSR